MTDIVPAEDVEDIVGVQRHPTLHYGRAVAAEQTVYILHPQECLDSGTDLRGCPFSRALDRGIEHPFPWAGWSRRLDQPVELRVLYGWLVPYDPDHRPNHSQAVAEEGRRLASRREDLIASGVDPELLEVPLHPQDTP